LKQRNLAWTVLTLVVAVVWLLTAAVAFADDPTSDQELQVERQLGCPICTNLPLNVCDNQICTQMKGVIHEKLAAGESPSQIIDYFVARYGDGVLLTPPNRGFNLAVWYGPIVAVLLGAVLVWLLVRGSLRRERELQQRLAGADPGLAEYRDRVRRDLEGSDDNR
jgi:cytochrome c-type biogenesis protein CcmH